MSTPTGLRLLEGLLERGEQRYKEGREQGLLRGKRDDIVRILTRRFSATPPAVATGLEAVGSAERLDALLDLAITVPDIDAFILALRTPMA